jgi:hypothetical protein
MDGRFFEMLKTDTESHLQSGPWHKECLEASIKALKVDDSTMSAINQYALEPLQASDIYAYQMKLANDQYDRDEERFTPDYLKRFADTLPGKSVMRGHDYRSEPAGRIYDADVHKDTGTGGNYLLVKAYLDADGPLTPVVRKGIAGHVSIGFNADQRLCDICGKDYDGYWKQVDADDEPCSHIKGRMYNGVKCTVTYGGDLDKVEGLEASHVWLGAQYGATTTRGAISHIRKAAHYDAMTPTVGGKGHDMDEKEMTAAKARESALQAEIDRLKPLADDGGKYRSWQKAEIARLYSSLGEQNTGAAMLKILDSADAETLDGVRRDVDKKHAAAFAAGGAQTGTADTDRTIETPRRTVQEVLWGPDRRQGGR